MKVTELPFEPLSGIHSESEQAGQQRSPGLHLSTVYADIEAQWVKRQPLDERDLAHYRAGGFLWEHAFSLAMRQALIGKSVSRPPEFELDGIVGSPDLVDYKNWAVWDTKFTWKSAAKLDRMERYFWPWITQMKGYLKMMQQLGPCCHAELYVFFVNGDYRPPVPSTRRLLLEFDQQEIDENWQMIVRHARNRGWL